MRKLFDGDRDQVASAVVEVEVVRVVRRAAPELLSQADRVVSHVAVIEITEAIRTRAALADPAALRSLDALHLATALEIGEELDAVVTYDARLAGAATSYGLPVLAPQ